MIQRWVASAFLGRPLGELDLRVVCIDGKVFRDHCMVIALGIDTQGRKHVLGLREGATETAAVTTGLLSDLVTRGLPTDRTLLFVVDGAQGLRRAITDVFGSRGVVQRCQVHKYKNIIGHLPERLHASVGKALRDAWNLDSADRAARVLERLAGSLARDHPGAAASIRPRRTGQIRPFMDTANPAISGVPRREFAFTSWRPVLARSATPDRARRAHAPTARRASGVKTSTAGTSPSRPGRKAHNCSLSGGTAGVSPARAEAQAEDARSALTRRPARSYLRPYIAASHRTRPSAAAANPPQFRAVLSSSPRPCLPHRSGFRPTHTCLRRAGCLDPGAPTARSALEHVCVMQEPVE